MGTIEEKNRRGFTLAELLIVVAIIAVLVAIAVPIFAGRLDKAKEATCKANRRSLYGQVVTEHILSDRPYSEIFEEYVGSAGKCPNGGVFSWEDSGDAGIITCSYHDGDGGSGSGSGGGSGSGSGLHMTPDITETTFTRGAVIQDDTGTCVIMSGMYETWTAYQGGAKVSELSARFGQDAVLVDATDIKDSSRLSELKTGDLYHDTANDTYYYVTIVSLYEDPPNSSWIPLMQ